MATRNLITFDWAMKRILRDKANFDVLEGFLSVLLNEKITIDHLLESESNKETDASKQNRVDLAARNSKGELIIVEVQYAEESDYFHRMLFGVSRGVCDYLSKGEAYAKIRKVYSVNIVYFDLGQGEDYVYHGSTVFRGIHNNDMLQLSDKQRKDFWGECAGDIFPEYYVLKVNNFNDVAKTDLDEWIEYLKHGKVKAETTVPGLKEAAERLREANMTNEERFAYEDYWDNIRSVRSAYKTATDKGWDEGVAAGRAVGIAEGIAEGRAEGMVEGRAVGRAVGIAEGRAEGIAEGIAEGEAKAQVEMASKAKAQGLGIEMIMALTGLSREEIEKL